MFEVKERFLYKDGKPFFWLGDTAWLIFNNLNKEEIKRYLKNRASLGFNVIQAVLLYTLPGKSFTNYMATNTDGYHNPLSEEYYDFVLEMTDYAQALGITMALLPTWGSVIKNQILSEEELIKYYTFLTDKFKDRDNIIWVLGGDVRGDVNLPLYEKLGSLLKERNPEKLVTFHPFGRTGSYLWFTNKKWLDFHMFQSGHRRYDQLNMNSWDDKSTSEDTFGEDAWKYVKKSFSKENKPVLDAEPSYEGIVQGLHDVKEPYWEARDVRRYAYFSVFSGACGFTYGNNAIIQFYTGKMAPSYGVREVWTDALSSPGGAEMQYLKKLMEKYDFTTLLPSENLILNQKERYHHSVCLANKDTILIYNYMGDKISINLRDYKNKTMEIYFMNPENNAEAYYDFVSGMDTIELRPVQKRELSNDWVIILRAAKKDA